MPAPARSAPISAIDPFCAEFFADPYPHHAAMRDAGPVVFLERYSIFGMARHAEVSAALTDWQTYSSASGVGIDDFRKKRPWRPASILLEVDPPLHTRTRTVMARILSIGAMRRLRAEFEGKAEALIEKLVPHRRFDAIEEIAKAYPLLVFPDAVGLRPEGRENLLPFGNMVFNSFGPPNRFFHDSIKAAEPVVAWINAQCARDMLSADGFGAEVYKALDAGEITAEEAPILVRSMLTAGLDTTVNGIGSAVYAFARNPEQWARLHADPSLARAAFEEVIRFEAPVQTFFRTTTRDVEIEGVKIPEGEKVLLFLGAANRDPRRWDNADSFDITRKTAGHAGFGIGIHGCVGQMTARLEGELVLAALARRVRSFGIVGEPVRHFNNTLRSLARLEVEVEAA